MNIAIYARISTDDERQCLDNQIEPLLLKAKAQLQINDDYEEIEVQDA